MTFRQHHWLIGLLMALLLWGCGSKDADPPKPSSNSSKVILEERKVEVTEVVSRSISYAVSAVGSLKTLEDVTISPKKAGIIEKILVKEGDRVKKGQILVQLDEVDAKLQVEMSEARVKEAEASLETNRTTLVRYQKLWENKVIPQQTYDEIILRVKLDEARLALAKAELNLAKQNLLDHRIVSPIKGVINLKIAFSEEKYFAILRFISPTADPNTRNVKMKALVQNPDYRLKPGFFAEVSIQTGGNPAALIIPESALFSQEGKLFTYTVQDETAKRKEVETGVRFDGKVEILKGIQKGDRVVTAGHEQLSEGMKVKVNKK